jgi:hypothetical protein
VFIPTLSPLLRKIKLTEISPKSDEEKSVLITRLIPCAFGRHLVTSSAQVRLRIERLIVKYYKSNSDDEYGNHQGGGGRRRRRDRQNRDGAHFEPWSQRRHSISFGGSGYLPSRSSMPYSSVPPFAYFPQYGIPFGYPPSSHFPLSYSGVLPPPLPLSTTSSYLISQQHHQQQQPFAHYTGYSHPMSSTHFGSIGSTYGESNRGPILNVVGGRAKAAAAQSHIQESNHSLQDPVTQQQSQVPSQIQTHLQPESSLSLLIESTATTTTTTTTSPVPSLKRAFCGACGTEIKLQFCSACGNKRE